MYLKINFNRCWHWEKCWQYALSNWSIFSTHGEKVHSFHRSLSIHWKRKRCSLSTKLSSVTVKPICLMHVERVRALRLDLKFQRSKKNPVCFCHSQELHRPLCIKRECEGKTPPSQWWNVFSSKRKKETVSESEVVCRKRHSLNLTFVLKILFLRNKKATHPYSSHAAGYEHITNLSI